MRGMPNYRTVEDVYNDFRGRRSALINALTVDVVDFFNQCDPERENLCLFGYPNGHWEVSLPAEEVPPELPEPALGINFARDSMLDIDWIALVAVHGDAWLLAIAFFFSSRFGFNKSDRDRLFNLINELPTVFELVTEKATRDKAKARIRAFYQREAETQAMRARQPQPLAQLLPQEEDESDSEEAEDEYEETSCGACLKIYSSNEFWICCDVCEKWYHGKCVKVTPNRAQNINKYVCPCCRERRGRRP